VECKETSARVDLPRYMGAWRVWTGRTTFLERGARNTVERYAWNAEKGRVDVVVSFLKGVEGRPRTMTQKAWVVAGTGNARWKISPFWPVSFVSVIVAFDPNYEWTAVGVPGGGYLWIMGRAPLVADARLAEVVAEVGGTGYPVAGVARVPQDR
jgi:apolipoprotein D and lipocalin family protein